MNLKIERIAIRISAAQLAAMPTSPVALGGYKLSPGGFVQVYSAVLSHVPHGTPYQPAVGSRFVIRYGGPTGPAAVDPLPAEGLIDQAEVSAGIFQPISSLVKSAPLFLCFEGGAPTVVGDGSLQLLLTCHDPVMRVLDDDF